MTHLSRSKLRDLKRKVASFKLSNKLLTVKNYLKVWHVLRGTITTLYHFITCLFLFYLLPQKQFVALNETSAYTGRELQKNGARGRIRNGI